MLQKGHLFSVIFFVSETYNSLAEPRSIVLGGALLMGAILLILMVMLMSIWFYRRHAQATGGVGGSYCQGTYGFGGQLMNTFGHGANIGGHDWKLMTSVNECECGQLALFNFTLSSGDANQILALMKNCTIVMF